MGNYYKACGMPQSSGRMICNIKELQTGSGKGGSYRDGEKLWKEREIGCNEETIEIA